MKKPELIELIVDHEITLKQKQPNLLHFDILVNLARVGNIYLEQGNKFNIEIGIWLDSQYQNQGYAIRSLNTLVSYAFKELGIEEIFAKVYIANEKSKKLMEKSGFALCCCFEYKGETFCYYRIVKNECGTESNYK